MEKYIKDGKVAVLYSPGYGSGWYTWNREYPELIFDVKVVEYVLKLKSQMSVAYDTMVLENYLKNKYPEIYIGSNLVELKIEWIAEGEEFKIAEYDGSEYVKLRSQDDGWFLA